MVFQRMKEWNGKTFCDENCRIAWTEKSIRRWFMWAVVFIASLAFAGYVFAGKPLYEIVEIEKVSKLPDKTPVTVFGYVQKAGVVDGRFGSKSILMQVGVGDKFLYVVSVNDIFGDYVAKRHIIQGIVAKPCWIGGIMELPMCIRLDDIIRDWGRG